MAVTINSERAREALLTALSLARSGRELPVEWISHARAVFTLESKTYTPALATLLLAKAVHPEIDTMSIKVAGERSYSLRGLGHGVVVPAAVEHNFSLRTTGAEPLNNQPWFRYNRIDEFERVKNRADYELFLSIAERANALSGDEALSALAAFLSVATKEAERIRAVTVKSDGLTADGLRIAAEDFLRSAAADRPRRLQAFAAACLDLGHKDVRARKINDPSRDVPGDVQAYDGATAHLSMEVRGKAVTPSEFSAFIESCARSGIQRAVLFVDASTHTPIDLDALDSYSLRMSRIQATAIESVADLVHSALVWVDKPLDEAVTTLAKRILERLREIEVPTPTLEEWARAVSLMQAR